MATNKKVSKAVAAKKAAAPKATAKKKAMAPAKPAPKKKAVAKAKVIPAANKASALSKIADLQAQVDGLKKDAVGELKEKLVEARNVVRGLEAELSTLAGSFASIRKDHRMR